MLFIHHYEDTEREEKPPARINHVARRFKEVCAPVLTGNTKCFLTVSSLMTDILSKPKPSWADYWEVVIEDSDL